LLRSTDQSRAAARGRLHARGRLARGRGTLTYHLQFDDLDQRTPGARENRVSRCAAGRQPLTGGASQPSLGEAHLRVLDVRGFPTQPRPAFSTTTASRSPIAGLPSPVNAHIRCNKTPEQDQAAWFPTRSRWLRSARSQTMGPRYSIPMPTTSPGRRLRLQELGPTRLERPSHRLPSRYGSAPAAADKSSSLVEKVIKGPGFHLHD